MRYALEKNKTTKTTIFKFSLLMNCFTLILFINLFTSCTYTKQQIVRDSRSWVAEYKEEILIQTEPPGARIYVQDEYIGTSPISSSLDGTKFTIMQTGDFTQEYKHGDFVSDGHWDHRRITETTWDRSGPVEFAYHYTIKVYKEGYEPIEKRIEITPNDEVFQKAFMKTFSETNKDEVNQPIYMGSRKMLLLLYPLSGRTINRSDSKTHSAHTGKSETSTSRGSGHCQQKRNEYEAALSAYNQALKEYDSAKTMGFIQDMNWSNKQYSEPGFDKGMSFLGMLSGKMTKTDAESKVAVAKQRLDAAKIQLCD